MACDLRFVETQGELQGHTAIEQSSTMEPVSGHNVAIYLLSVLPEQDDAVSDFSGNQRTGNAVAAESASSKGFRAG